MERRSTPATDKPNAPVIWRDDSEQSNLSCFSNGVMSYRTKNIDRIASGAAGATSHGPMKSGHMHTGVARA